jgi:hypothetical protein
VLQKPNTNCTALAGDIAYPLLKQKIFRRL